MNLAWLSLIALFIAIAVSCTTPINVGVLAVALAWIVGVYFGGMKVEAVASGFPVALFLTLAGVTLLFTQAQVNGTLDRLSQRALRFGRGNAGLIPVSFFVLAAGLASMGPGNIATAALIAPMAMAVAARAGIPPFLMAIMVGNGANAGSLSPFAPTGVIVNGLMAKIGLPGLEWQTYLNNLLAHAAVAFSGYLLFGGWKLFRSNVTEALEETKPFERNHYITLGTIFALICAVLFLKANVGMGAFAAAVLLTMVGAADHENAVKRMPWNVIVMVSGVTVLIALLEKTQGLDLFTDLLAHVSNRSTVTGFMAFLTGLISVYSSTSGVVLPAFLPTIPGLIERLGGGDAVAIASSMNVGSHLVDVSPLSTIGALCIAAMPDSSTSRTLFNQLLAWGMSMTIVAGVICWLLF